MATRTVLCIDQDRAAVDRIRGALESYDFQIQSIPDGDHAIEWARSNQVALIILCVEPRKMGYAICNKIKRSPSLRTVPLILTSAEETEAAFAQHKTLRSHADEYLLKPLDSAVLLAKIDALITLGDSQVMDADSDAIIIADEDIDAEVSMDAEPADEAVPAPAAVVDSAPHFEDEGKTTVMLGDEPTRTASKDDLLSSFDTETAAAFAALQAGTEEEPQIAAAASPDGVADALLGIGESQPWSSEETRIDNGESLPARLISALPDPQIDGNAGPAAGSDMMTMEAMDASVAPAAEDVTGFDSTSFDAAFATSAPAPAEVEFSAPVSEPAVAAAPVLETADALEPVLEAEPAPLPESAFSDEEAPPMPDEAVADAEPGVDPRVVGELRSQLQLAEAERDSLRKEVAELRERGVQTQAFSKEREYLSLREMINKKEKDILDLRDELDAKERQVLDHKDKIRELERSRRDLEERCLGFERNMVAAQEKSSALDQEKQKSVERERILKARLDDAHEEIRKSHDETESLKKRLAGEAERAKAEQEKLRHDLETKLAEMDDAHRLEITKMTDERTASEAAKEAAHQAELSQLETEHASLLESVQRKAADELSAANDRAVGESVRLKKEQEKAIAALRDEHAAQLQAERQSHESSAEAKERGHRDEIMGLRRRHEEEMAAAEERRQRDIAAEEARRLSELEAAEGRRRAELQARDEQHHARVTELERRHLGEKTEISERLRAEVDQTLARAGRAEGELAARNQELEQLQHRFIGLQGELDAVRAELRDRDVKLNQQQLHIAELEAKVTDYEDQVVRAYQRIRSDERNQDKARRALAVALTLLDERTGAVVAAAAAGSSPTKTEDTQT